MTSRITRAGRALSAVVWSFALYAASAALAPATTLYAFDLPTQAARAAAVVVATPVRVETYPEDTATGRVVFTFTTLSVERVLKGSVVTGEPLVIKSRGGVYAPESLATYVEELPALAVGDRYVLFLGADRAAPWDCYFLQSRSLGAYHLTEPADGASRAVRLSPAGAEIGGAGARATTLADIERTVAETPAEILPPHYASAPSVPPGFRTGIGAEVSDVRPAFALWNPPTRWNECDAGQAVTFLVNESTYTWPGSLNTAVIWACSQWSGISGSRLRVQNGGATSYCGFNAINHVTTIAGDCNNELEGNGCYSGVIAEGGPRTLKPGSVVVGGTTYRIVESADIVLNDGGCDLSQAGINGVVTHEMGHCLGLQHSTSPACCTTSTPTMYPQYFTGNDSLADDDRAGMRVIYPPPPGPPDIDAVTPNQGERGVTTSVTITGSNLVASGPTTVTVSGNGIGAVTVAAGATSSQLVVSIPVQSIANLSQRTLTVTTSAGSDSKPFTVVGIVAPSDLAATPASSTSIRLTWSDASRVETSYKVQRQAADGTWTNVATLNANATTYTDTGLRASKRYVYRVRVANATDSANSNQASATTPAR